MVQRPRIGRLLAVLLLSTAITATAVAQPAHAQPAASATTATSRTQALEDLFAPWNHSDRPGCALGVAAAGGPPLLRFYGSADLEHDVPIREDTVFEAGSVSKQFTAASILLLVQQGKLALSDEVRRYLPELPDYGAPITIDQLLSHTSGLRDWGERPRGPKDRQQTRRAMRRPQPRSPNPSGQGWSGARTSAYSQADMAVMRRSPPG